MAALHHDAADFSDSYDAYLHRVYAYFVRRGPAEDAHDATADTFVVVWRRWQTRPTDDDLLPWIYGIARNVLANRNRTLRRQGRLVQKLTGAPALTEPNPPDAVLTLRSEHDDVLRALSRLSAVEQETLRLIEWEGLTREQVAMVFDVSRAAIDQRVSRAHRRMERLLRSESPSTESAPTRTSAKGRR